MKKIYSNEVAERMQIKSLDPKNDAEIDSQIYGDDRNTSTQVITNYYYNIRKK